MSKEKLSSVDQLIASAQARLENIYRQGLGIEVDICQLEISLATLLLARKQAEYNFGKGPM